VHRFKGVDGGWYSVLARGVPLRNAAGEALGWAGINLDITQLQKSEQEVVRLAAESERQRRLYETVLKNTPDLAYVFDLNHRFTYANHALLTMWGRTWEASIGKTCLEVGYEPWHAALHDREIEQVVATKQPIRGEVAFDGTNGRRQYDYILVPVIGADGEVEAVAGTTRDVTERQQTEDQLRRNHDTFFALIQNNPFGVYAVDADFRLRQVSLGAQKVFATVRPLLGRDFAEVLRTLWPEPFASEAIGRFRHTLDTGEPYSAPSTVERRADIGAVETYDWRIERITLPDGRYGVVCYFYDLSERQRWEATLRDSEERLRLATNAAQLGIWTWQPDRDVVVWENDRPYEIFALPRGEPPVTAARFKADFLHPEDTATFDIAFARAERLKVPLLCECRIRRTDGETRWVEFTGRVVEGEENVRLIGTVQDITDRKQIEEEQRRLAKELQDAHRRKDEFLATLAHELRNPLAPISNGLQIMRLAGANGTIERARTIMERQLTQLVRLVDDLLDMSRVTSGKLELRREWVELSAVIDAAIETSRPAIDQAQHELAVVVPDEPIFLNGDATRLAQVVSNLLNNSAKYTHRGGHVRLTVRLEDDMAVLVVADDGIGIPPKMLGKVFEMFTQVDRALEKTTGGLGIGLSLVKGVVEMHGGTIEARSEGEGRGSEFIVRLPLGLSAIQKVEPPAADAPVRSSSRRRILVADDNVDSAESLRELLEWLGNDVKTANDGLQAVVMAETFRPHVILLDIGMPKLNGHETCLRIREQPWGKNAILVAMTGWGQDEDKRRSQEAGFDHHLVKPVDPGALEKLWASSKAEEA
jgi:PAS domain S-box-containing protein